MRGLWNAWWSGEENIISNNSMGVRELPVELKTIVCSLCMLSRQSITSPTHQLVFVFLPLSPMLSNNTWHIHLHIQFESLFGVFVWPLTSDYQFSCNNLLDRPDLTMEPSIGCQSHVNISMFTRRCFRHVDYFCLDVIVFVFCFLKIDILKLLEPKQCHLTEWRSNVSLFQSTLSIQFKRHRPVARLSAFCIVV